MIMSLKIKTYLLTIGLLTGLCGCQDETGNPVAEQEKEVTIQLSISQPGKTKNPATYAMPQNETTINTVDVLMFKTDPTAPNDPSAGTFLYRATVGYKTGSTSFTARFTGSEDNQTIVVLVNCRTLVNTLMNTISTGESKTNVIKALTLTQSDAFDPETMTGIPMWGEITNQQIVAGYSPSGLNVKLTRMLAKINIVNNDAANFTLTGAFLYNPRQKGSVIPDNWNGTTVTSPTLTIGSEMAQGTNFGPFTTTSDNRIENKIYTFEADNANKSAADSKDGTCVIVRGNYQGSSETCYYRIDIKNYTTNTVLDILRNYQYDITIRSVTGPGGSTTDDVYKSDNQINASVELWNQETGDAQYGSNRLYVSNRHPVARLDGSPTVNADRKSLIINTTYPGGWQWKEDAETQETRAAFDVTTEGGAANMDVTVNWGKDLSATNPEGLNGNATIVSGALEYTLIFFQGNCGENGVSSPMRIGKNIYQTYLYPTSEEGVFACWMVENSTEGSSYSSKGYGLDANGVVIDSSSVHPISAVGLVNGYYYSQQQAMTYNNACPSGWSLPDSDKWFVLKSALSLNRDSSARWWLGVSGVDNNAFAGYPYSSMIYWINWGAMGAWWVFEERIHYVVCDKANVYLDITDAAANLSCLSVRCVKDYY